MLLSMADELQEKTRVYWELSRARNGQSSRDIATGTAIHLANYIIYSTNPMRPLNFFTTNLLEDIIYDIPRVAGSSADPIPFKRQAE